MWATLLALQMEKVDAFCSLPRIPLYIYIYTYPSPFYQTNVIWVSILEGAHFRLALRQTTRNTNRLGVPPFSYMSQAEIIWLAFSLQPRLTPNDLPRVHAIPRVHSGEFGDDLTQGKPRTLWALARTTIQGTQALGAPQSAIPCKGQF